MTCTSVTLSKWHQESQSTYLKYPVAYWYLTILQTMRYTSVSLPLLGTPFLCEPLLTLLERVLLIKDLIVELEDVCPSQPESSPQPKPCYLFNQPNVTSDDVRVSDGS